MKMKVLKSIYFFGMLTVLIGVVSFFTPAAMAAKPTIHALLVIMDGDALNAKQYKKNSTEMKDFLDDVERSTVCNLKLTTLRSGSNYEREWPTRDRIFRWVRAVSAQPNDVVFVYFCGHGGKLSDAVNNRTLKDREFDGTFFSLDGETLFRKQLVDALKASSAWRSRLKMLITDTCSLEVFFPIQIQIDKLDGEGVFAMKHKARVYRQLFAEHEGFLHLTSASEGELSWGDDKKGGWFTYGLMKSIDDSVSASRTQFITWEKVLFITWEKVLEDTKTEVKKLIKGNRDQVGTNKQNPKYYGTLPARSGSSKSSMSFSDYVDRANAKSERKQYTSAIKDFSTAIRLKPDYHIAYLGRAHAKMGRSVKNLELNNRRAAFSDVESGVSDVNTATTLIQKALDKGADKKTFKEAIDMAKALIEMAQAIAKVLEE